MTIFFYYYYYYYYSLLVQNNCARVFESIDRFVCSFVVCCSSVCFKYMQINIFDSDWNVIFYQKCNSIQTNSDSCITHWIEMAGNNGKYQKTPKIKKHFTIFVFGCWCWWWWWHQWFNTSTNIWNNVKYRFWRETNFNFKPFSLFVPYYIQRQYK